MTRTLDVVELEALEPQLKALVEREGQVVLTHNGEPLAMLVPLSEEQPSDGRQPPGSLNR
jgi:antitoxin (DNA-binding transcriptional repressor) of toxin-antitoxin stability system